MRREGKERRKERNERKKENKKPLLRDDFFVWEKLWPFKYVIIEEKRKK
jgi:hypothetical protein